MSTTAATSTERPDLLPKEVTGCIEASPPHRAGSRVLSDGKPRPVVVVQDDRFDATASVTVCAFTTDPTDAPLIRLLIEADEVTGIRESTITSVRPAQKWRCDSSTQSNEPVGQIRRSPHSGSLRFSYELAIPGLRVRPVTRFPYLVFYVVGDEVVDVWRILHSRRDIPSAVSGDVDV